VLIDVRLWGGALGYGLAFANAGLFALYIVLAHRVSRRSSLGGIDGLAAAMLAAVPMVTVLGGWQAGPHLLDPVALGAGLGVGVSSSVIPYVCDQLAMARLRRATYSLMVSLLPATATVVGLVVLGQTPSARQLAGVALVVTALLVAEEMGGGDQKHLGAEDRERSHVQRHGRQDPRAGTEVGLSGQGQVPERAGDQLLRV
jgi:inner membrane transporter RhtA